MRILFIGGDKRTLEIINILKERYADIDIVGYNTLALDTIKLKEINNKYYDVIIFPVDGIKDDCTVTSYFNESDLFLNEMDLNIKERTLVFSGVKTSKLDSIFGNNYIKLMDFDDVSIKNSIPTAEGVIANIIENTDYTINDSNIVVLGYGRCGKTLTQKLIGLGATVSVGISENSNDSFLKQNRVKLFSTKDNMKENIKNCDIIVNTVPALLLDSNNLNHMKKNVYIIDISSYPYGIDFEYAQTKNIKAVLLSSIPGKVAPKIAGKILADKIINIIKELK